MQRIQFPPSNNEGMISGKKKGQQFSTIDETENQSLVELFV